MSTFRNQHQFKASPFKTAKFKSQAQTRGRSKSPNRSFAARSNCTSSVSLHSQNILNSLDQVQIFPSYYLQLMKNQDRNIGWFKSQINKQKQRVCLEIEALSVELMHVIQDYKLSLIAILDRIYQNYISKYAQFKSEVMEINRIQDQILMQVNVRPQNLHSPGRNNKISNDYAVKSMESNLNQMRKLKIMDYITQIQKQKAIPLNEISEYIVILSEYENGFFQSDQFKEVISHSKQSIKGQFRQLIQNAYTYIRSPDGIIAKQSTNNKYKQRKQDKQEHILGDINDQQSINAPVNIRKHQNFYNSTPPVRVQKPPISEADNFYPNFNSSDNQSAYQNEYRNQQDQIFLGNKKQNFHHPHQHQHSQVVVSSNMNRISVDELKLNQKKYFKNVSSEIMLCCLYITDNLIVTGNKDGSLIFYDEKGNVHKSFQKQHTSSVCSLAVINDGQYLASGSDYPNSQIYLWNLSTLEPVCNFKEHKAAVTAIACLRDGEHMISGSYDKKLCIYSFHEQRPKYTLPSNKSSVTAISLNSDGTKMISCGLEDKMLNIWQIVRKQKVQTLFLEQIIQNSTMICSMVSSATKKNILYIGSKDGRVKIVDIDKGQAIKSMNVCNNALIQMVVYEQKGQPLIFGWPCKQKCLKVIDCETGKIVSISTKGTLEFSCGVGPKASSNRDSSGIIVGSQGEDRQISFYYFNRSL